MRKRVEWFQALPADQKHEMRKRWRSMNPEKREKMRERFRNMTPEEREKARERMIRKRQNRQ